MQPGTVINPDQPENDGAKEETAPEAPQPDATPQNTPPQPEQAPLTPEEEPKQPGEPVAFQSTGFEANDIGPADSDTQQNTPAAAEVSWTASEYIAHQKDPKWYFSLAFAGLLVAALVYLITQDRIATGTIFIVTILFGVFAARKPEVLEYTVTSVGINIGQRHYAFDDFKSFSIHDDSALPSVFFWPTKRFMPGLTIYFPPEQAAEIVNTLSLYLPHEDRQPEAVDRLMKRIRF